ncbi:MAG: Uma2 family endonuclease [Myxococcales bacterium]|nr:Uma2 family endonuclease [Myxococcales bacterium]
MSMPASDPRRAPLEHGQRLTSEEFDTRYEASPHIRKAELIRGVVVVASPTSVDHGLCHGDVVTWLGVYEAHRMGEVQRLLAPTVHLVNGARVEPDGVLRRLGPDGASRVVGEGPAARVHGAPELLVEVSIATRTMDLDDVHGKMADYRESGVREYLVVAPAQREATWLVLQDGAYVSIEPTHDGVLQSRVFPGLRLDVAALFERDLSRLLAVLQSS